MPIRHSVHPRLADVRELGDGDRREVECDRDGLAMEVPAADHAMILGEHDRVVGHRVDLDLEDSTCVRERVARGAVYLGHAADRIRILYAGIADAMRRYVRACGHERS